MATRPKPEVQQKKSNERKGHASVLSRTEDWVWDSWYVVEGDTLHAFTLTAPKLLGNPELRHVNARVGHSVSHDGITWTHLQDAIGPSDGDGFDSQATWTGCIVREANEWHMFYTGIDREHRERRQAIGHAVSLDLHSWTRVATSPIVRATADYALLGNVHDGSEHFRDPWVFRHDGSWHMLVTASDPAGWGTIGHATSPDLMTWDTRSPLVSNSGFKQLEVTQTICLDGQWVVLFCAAEKDVCRDDVLAGWGTYSAPADGPLGPFHLDRAELFAPNVYAARAVLFRGQWVLFGFISDGTEAGFDGVISDPLPLDMTNRGTVELTRSSRARR